MNNVTDIGISFKNSVTGEKKLEKFAETLTKINSALVGIDKGKVGDLEQTAKNLKEVEKTNEKVKDIKGGLFDVVKINALVRSFKNLVKTFSQMASKSATYLENMNLLDVAYNNNTVEAKKLVNTMTEMYGLDESWGYRTIGLFKQLSNAMGLADETGVQLSKTLTLLSVDLASLYNVNTQSSVEKLTSALAGQTKPIRTFGADITEATLQMTLMENGIDKLVSNLSFAEKRLVIVTAILNQTKEAQGDWGRTIESIANQMRIMDEQISRLTRALGNVFMPVLKVILPYLNAFLMVLTEITSWIATLVGYNEEEFDYFGGAEDIVGELEEKLNNATQSSEKLKGSLRGFDKLNNITTPSIGGGASGGLGIDKDILDMFNKASNDYLEKFEKVEMKATRIRKAIMEWLGFEEQIDDETKEVSYKFEKITGGTILGALAIGGTIYTGVKSILSIIGKITGKKIFGSVVATNLAGTIGKAGTVGTSGKVAGATGLSGVYFLLALIATAVATDYVVKVTTDGINELVELENDMRDLREQNRSANVDIITQIINIRKQRELTTKEEKNYTKALEIARDELHKQNNELETQSNKWWAKITGQASTMKTEMSINKNQIDLINDLLKDMGTYTEYVDEEAEELRKKMQETANNLKSFEKSSNINLNFTTNVDSVKTRFESVLSSINQSFNNSSLGKLVSGRATLKFEPKESINGIPTNPHAGATDSALFNGFSYQPILTFRANGGLPPVGQMFIANEKGPEIVGHIGGQSFVANQNQMMDLLDKKLGNANGGIKNATFVINVGSEEIGRVVLNDLNSMAKDNGKPIIIGG